MRKISIIGLLLFIFAFAGQSQKIYSVENLEQASQEDLNTYLDKALKLKKDGKTVTIVGSALSGAGIIIILLNSNDWEMMGKGSAVVLAGFGTMAVGIPMKITGKKKN